jgi:hypothetical protein
MSIEPITTLDPSPEEFISKVQARNSHLSEHERALLDAGEMLWVVLANVSGGDWEKQTSEWQLAARRWADNFHAVASSINAKAS